SCTRSSASSRSRVASSAMRNARRSTLARNRSSSSVRSSPRYPGVGCRPPQRAAGGSSTSRFSPVVAPIETPVEAIAAPVEAAIDPVALALEPVGEMGMAVRLRDVRASVEAVLDAIPAPVESLVDPVAAIFGEGRRRDQEEQAGSDPVKGLHVV